MSLTCAASVKTRGTAMQWHRCRNRATDGSYCRLHSTAGQMERQAARDERRAQAANLERSLYAAKLRRKGCR